MSDTNENNSLSHAGEAAVVVVKNPEVIYAHARPRRRISNDTLLRVVFAGAALTISTAAVLYYEASRPEKTLPQKPAATERGLPKNFTIVDNSPVGKFRDEVNKRMGRIAYLYEIMRPEAKNCEDFKNLPVLVEQRKSFDKNNWNFEKEILDSAYGFFEDIDPNQYPKILRGFESLGQMASTRSWQLSSRASLNKEDQAELSHLAYITKTVQETRKHFKNLDAMVNTYVILLKHPETDPSKVEDMVSALGDPAP